MQKVNTILLYRFAPEGQIKVGAFKFNDKGGYFTSIKNLQDFEDATLVFTQEEKEELVRETAEIRDLLNRNYVSLDTEHSVCIKGYETEKPRIEMDSFRDKSFIVSKKDGVKWEKLKKLYDKLCHAADNAA